MQYNISVNINIDSKQFCYSTPWASGRGTYEASIVNLSWSINLSSSWSCVIM